MSSFTLPFTLPFALNSLTAVVTLSVHVGKRHVLQFHCFNFYESLSQHLAPLSNSWNQYTMPHNLKPPTLHSHVNSVSLLSHSLCLQLSAQEVFLDYTTNTAISLTKFKAAYTVPAIIRLSTGIQSDASSCFLSSPLQLFTVPGASFSTNFTVAMSKYAQIWLFKDANHFVTLSLHVWPTHRFHHLICSSWNKWGYVNVVSVFFLICHLSLNALVPCSYPTIREMPLQMFSLHWWHPRC